MDILYIIIAVLIILLITMTVLYFLKNTTNQKTCQDVGYGKPNNFVAPCPTGQSCQVIQTLGSKRWLRSDNDQIGVLSPDGMLITWNNNTLTNFARMGQPSYNHNDLYTGASVPQSGFAGRYNWFDFATEKPLNIETMRTLNGKKVYDVKRDGKTLFTLTEQ